jgi:ent-kaurene oxidase
MFVIYLLNVLKKFFVQAMIMKYETISSKKLPLALQILTKDKTLVAFSNYDNEYRMLKKVLVGHLLNINIQVATILYLSFIDWVMHSIHHHFMNFGKY